MKNLYQQTFDNVQLSEDKAASMRAMLTSRSSVQKTEQMMEECMMKKQKFLRRPVGFVLTVLFVFGLGGTAFAYGTGIIETVYQLMAGGVIEHGIDENGDAYAAASLSAAQAPIELRDDGKLYLIVNGENKDITDLCSYTTPYIYECVDENGLRHAFVIGGDLDAIGWAEYMWDEEGLPSGGTAMFGTNGGRDDAPWLDAGLKELGLPW